MAAQPPPCPLPHSTSESAIMIVSAGRLRPAMVAGPSLCDVYQVNCLVVCPANLCRFWQDGNAGAAPGPMPPSLSPDKRMPMLVPVNRRLGHRLAHFFPGLEAAPLQGQGAQHLPPWLDQVQVRRILGQEHELPARMRQAEQQ